MSVIKIIDYNRPYRLWASSIVMKRSMKTISLSMWKNAMYVWEICILQSFSKMRSISLAVCGFSNCMRCSAMILWDFSGRHSIYF